LTGTASTGVSTGGISTTTAAVFGDGVTGAAGAGALEIGDRGFAAFVGGTAGDPFATCDAGFAAVGDRGGDAAALDGE
jgi:hypothetical protein